MFWTSINLKEFPAGKNRRKRWPLISGGFIKQKAAAKVCNKSLLLALATDVGTPIKVDIHTLDASRGRFARVCIEIYLDKPVVGKIWFRNYWYHVEYERLHLLCKGWPVWPCGT
jgi:hypothetical protein